jgi:hypothetical protein
VSRWLLLVALVAACDGTISDPAGDDPGGSPDAPGSPDRPGSPDAGGADVGADGGAIGGGADGGPVVTGPCAPPAGTSYGDASDAIFDRSRLLVIELEMDVEDWAYQLDNPDLEEYRPVAVAVCGERVEGAGLRFKKSELAGSDLEDGYPKNPMVIDMNEFAPGQKLFGLRKLDLEYGDDKLLVAERLNWELMAAFGLAASRVSSARVYMNGEYLGVFNNIERVDESFAEYHFGDGGDGHLYKHSYCGTYAWEGSAASAYSDDPRCYNPVPDDSGTDYADIIRVADVANNTPDGALDEELPAVWEMDSWLRIGAAQQVLAYGDAPFINGNNYYTYFPEDGGPAEHAMWDMDGGFWSTGSPCAGGSDNTQRDLFQTSECKDFLPLFHRVIEVPAWRAQYLEAAREFLVGPFAHDRVSARVEVIVDQVAEALAEDPNRSGDDDEWAASVGEIIERHELRVANVRAQLEDLGIEVE